MEEDWLELTFMPLVLTTGLFFVRQSLVASPMTVHCSYGCMSAWLMQVSSASNIIGSAFGCVVSKQLREQGGTLTSVVYLYSMSSRRIATPAHAVENI
jgi:hypothetical protein